MDKYHRRLILLTTLLVLLLVLFVQTNTLGSLTSLVLSGKA